MALRRGFKSEANQIAREVRSELGIRFSDPLNPIVLAEQLGIPVVPIRQLHAPEEIAYFHGKGASEFSAATIFIGTKRVIIHNDSHSDGRRSSNIAHELAHSLLHHPSTPPLSQLGCRNWDKNIEEEANWLGGALLVPEEAALKIARSGMSIDEAAKNYLVTSQMIRFRLNVTGAMKRASSTSM